MKKIFLIILMLLSFAFTNAQDSNWTIQGDSSFSYISMDGFSGGTLDVTALYSLSENLQVGAAVGLNLGDFDGTPISAAARYFLTDSWFLNAAIGLTDDTPDGLDIGFGKRYMINDSVELNPGLSYNTDMESLGLVIGFAIKL